jgi:hypothetical protein
MSTGSLEGLGDAAGSGAGSAAGGSMSTWSGAGASATACMAESGAGSESDRSATPAEPPSAASITLAPIIMPRALRRNAPRAPLPRAKARRSAPSASKNVLRTMRGMTGIAEPETAGAFGRVTGSGVGVTSRPRGATPGAWETPVEKVSTGVARSSTAPQSNCTEDIGVTLQLCFQQGQCRMGTHR